MLGARLFPAARLKPMAKRSEPTGTPGLSPIPTSHLGSGASNDGATFMTRYFPPGRRHPPAGPIRMSTFQI